MQTSILVNFNIAMHQSFATVAISGLGNIRDCQFSVCKAQVLAGRHLHVALWDQMSYQSYQSYNLHKPGYLVGLIGHRVAGCKCLVHNFSHV